MISDFEIKEVARRNGVPETTVERDYAQNWFLAELSSASLRMALKGGTGLRKLFIEDYRFSDDLDFTLLDDVNNPAEEVIEAVRRTKKESGIEFDEGLKVKEVENGYEILVYFRFLRTTGNPMRIKLDMTKKENEIIILPLEKREIKHHYSDNCNAEVLTYQLEETFAEKIRSLFQRTRPRDLYDVWYLSGLELSVNELLAKKFRFKNVKPDLKDLKNRRNYFERAWENSLKHQLRTIPEFEVVFYDVSNLLTNMDMEMQ